MADDVKPGLGAFFLIVDDIPATEDETGYEALTLAEVGELTDIPEYGPEHDTVTHVPLKTGITQKFHGAINQGSVTLPMALSKTDTGQIALRAALASKKRVTFCTTYADGSKDYMQGKVMSYMRGASINSVVQASIRIEIETTIIEVAAP